MDGKLRNMTSIYLTQGDKILLLYRQGGRVVSDTWVASAGGHFEPYELNDARACVLRELREEIGLGENNLQNLHLRYITLRHTKGEIRQNYYFFAELTAKLPDVSSNEGTLQWFELSDTPRHLKCRSRLNLSSIITVQPAAAPNSYTAA